MRFNLASVLSSLFEKIKTFVLGLGAKQGRVLWVSALLIIVSVLIMVAGNSNEGQRISLELTHTLQIYAHSPLAIVIVIGVYCVAALIGAPQFVLIAATVVAFGPIAGFGYSWVATIVSAALTYGLGLFAGPYLFKKLKIGSADILPGSLGDNLHKNAFIASFMIRNIPTAPFIVVNMAFGLAKAPFASFLSGCALGIVPKTALVVFLGSSYQALLKGKGIWSVLFMLFLSILWLVAVLAVRDIIRKKLNDDVAR